MGDGSLHRFPFCGRVHSSATNCGSCEYDVVSLDVPVHNNNCQCHLEEIKRNLFKTKNRRQNFTAYEFASKFKLNERNQNKKTEFMCDFLKFMAIVSRWNFSTATVVQCQHIYGNGLERDRQMMTLSIRQQLRLPEKKMAWYSHSKFFEIIQCETIN